MRTCVRTTPYLPSKLNRLKLGRRTENSDQKNWRSREVENDILIHIGIRSVWHVSVLDFQLRWSHRTGIGIPFALRSPASASSVGCNSGAGRSAPVGWIGAGDFLLTPMCMWLFKSRKNPSSLAIYRVSTTLYKIIKSLYQVYDLYFQVHFHLGNIAIILYTFCMRG